MQLKLKFFSSTIFIFIFLLSCSSIKDFYVDKSFKISEKQIHRLANYINGEFFSYEIKRKINAYPLAFMISSDGSKSIILACFEMTNNCNPNVKIYQLILKYNKKFNEDFKILALGTDLKTNDKNLAQKIKDKNLKKIIKINNIFFDNIILPLDNCGDDC